MFARAWRLEPDRRLGVYKMKIGVAISVYDKKDFVMTNAAVLKKYWSIDPWISVCCNDPKTFEQLAQCEGIDDLVSGDDIEVVKSSEVKRKKSLRMRQHDCIRKSVSSAAKKSDYVIHWHADAFALKEDSVLEIIQEMKEKNIMFAARGLWKKYMSSKVPRGDIDDHFFIVESRFLEESKILEESNWDKVCSLVNSGVCSEGILSFLFDEQLSEEQILIYSDMSECEVPKNSSKDNRYSDKLPHRTLPPINIDPDRAFVHCDLYDELPSIFNRFNVPTKFIK